MPDSLSHADLIARIALNSRLTAHEVEEALEVLAVVIQENLQQRGSVDVLGLGTFSVDADSVVFVAGQSLEQAVADPASQIQIDRAPGTPPSRLYLEAEPYAHKVNVC